MTTSRYARHNSCVIILDKHNMSVVHCSLAVSMCEHTYFKILKPNQGYIMFDLELIAINEMLDRDFFVWMYEEGYTETELEILHNQTIIYNLDGDIRYILGE